VHLKPKAQAKTKVQHDEINLNKQSDYHDEFTHIRYIAKIRNNQPAISKGKKSHCEGRDVRAMSQNGTLLKNMIT
jgi:hypothetical protein